MNIFQRFKNFLRAPRLSYEPLIEVRIFKDAILHNLAEYRRVYPHLAFAPVLKSNAYGHGLVEVAKILDNRQTAFFVVDSFYEAVVLRKENIQSKILIIGYATEGQIFNDNLADSAFAITSLEQLQNIASKLTRPKRFHLKVDTGMARQGVWPEEIEKSIQLIKSNENIILEGSCTHFADAKNTDDSYTREQIAKWNASAQKLKREFPGIKYLHAGSTSGVYYSKDTIGNVGRIGLGLYGLDNAPHSRLSLKPALEIWSVVSLVKNLPAGRKVGYSGTFESSKSMTIASVPVGYNEGVDRRLSNRGSLKIGRAVCPIVGRVSMNMTTIDVSSVPGVKLESKVLILSRNARDGNSLENLARLCDCIPHEILVHIPQYLRRNVI